MTLVCVVLRIVTNLHLFIVVLTKLLHTARLQVGIVFQVGEQRPLAQFLLLYERVERQSLDYIFKYTIKYT